MMLTETKRDSTDYDTDNVSDGDFDDSDVGSISSKMSAETDPGVDHLIDSTPAKKGTEVDLSGFHDVCRKILARPLPQGYKTGVLCRYKFSSAAERVQLEKQRQKEKRKQSKTKKTWENVARNVEPEVNSHEKELQGLARRGVIDFFNAIEKHQSELKRKLEDAGPTELRQSKVIKDVKETDITDKLDGEQEKSKAKWSVLDKGLTVPEDGSDEDEEMEA